MKTAAIAMCLVWAAPAAADWTHKPSGISLPDSIGDMTEGGTRQLERPEAGCLGPVWLRSSFGVAVITAGMEQAPGASRGSGLGGVPANVNAARSRSMRAATPAVS